VEYLNNSNFHFREGSSRVRDITVDAHLLLGRKYLSTKKYGQALEQFLATVETPQDSKTSTSHEDIRNPQINYYIALAYELLGKKADALTYFRKSAEQPSGENGYIRYYQGLSFLKLDKKKASECFNALISEGEKRIKMSSDIDFFAKFGEREAENVRLSNAYLLKGLGYKGLGDVEAATENLNKAVELSVSNLYAKVELEK
jgi:tetratricopeptide (TPR) repeat protein